jgi:hypothetical protein
MSAFDRHSGAARRSGMCGRERKDGC